MLIAAQVIPAPRHQPDGDVALHLIQPAPHLGRFQPAFGRRQAVAQNVAANLGHDPPRFCPLGAAAAAGATTIFFFTDWGKKKRERRKSDDDDVAFGIGVRGTF